MCDQERDAALAQLYPLDLAELVLCLLFGDAVDGEAALGVVDEAEVLARLLDADDVHEAGWVGGIGAHFAVDLDEALHHDRFGFAGVEGVLEAVISLYVSMSFRWHISNTIVAQPYRLRMKTIKGMQSLNLCGPGLALGA